MPITIVIIDVIIIINLSLSPMELGKVFFFVVNDTGVNIHEEHRLCANTIPSATYLMC